MHRFVAFKLANLARSVAVMALPMLMDTPPDNRRPLQSFNLDRKKYLFVAISFCALSIESQNIALSATAKKFLSYWSLVFAVQDPFEVKLQEPLNLLRWLWILGHGGTELK